MSASREKKKRQELFANGAVDAKTAREAEQIAADKRSNILYGVLAAAFVILAIFLVVYNSGFIDRNKTAVTIDGQEYSVPEAAYYYQQAYQGFLNSSEGYYAVALGMLDTKSSLKSQSYDDSKTWDEYFKELAVSNMQFVHAAKKAAQADNMTLEQADLDTYHDNISSLKTDAAKAGYSYRSYLTAIYGATMTPSIYETCEKDRLLASKFANAKRDGLSFTDDEISAYYDENKDSYDLVDGAYVSVSGTPETKTDEDGNAIEATEDEKLAAMAEAKKTADDILAAYLAGGDLESLAEQHDAGYIADEEMRSNSSVYSEWLFDAARKAGDAAVVEDESGSQYYVAVFNSRKRDEALDYNVRHILVTKDSLDLAEGEEADDDKIKAKAEEILAGWNGTETGFATLAEQYSQDEGSKTNGGLYENVAKGAMVTEFNDWCYEAGRKAGDTGIVSSSYGQHIMYFVGYGDTQYWHYACENALIAEAFDAWYDETTDSVTAEVDANGMDAIGV